MNKNSQSSSSHCHFKSTHRRRKNTCTETEDQLPSAGCDRHGQASGNSSEGDHSEDRAIHGSPIEVLVVDLEAIMFLTVAEYAFMSTRGVVQIVDTRYCYISGSDAFKLDHCTAHSYFEVDPNMASPYTP